LGTSSTPTALCVSYSQNDSSSLDLSVVLMDPFFPVTGHLLAFAMKFMAKEHMTSSLSAQPGHCNSP
jgi:hypothetical protein